MQKLRLGLQPVPTQHRLPRTPAARPLTGAGALQGQACPARRAGQAGGREQAVDPKGGIWYSEDVSYTFATKCNAW